MKRYILPLKELLRGAFLLLTLLLWVNMGETEKDRTNTAKGDEPHFVPLEEGEGNYAGIIDDESTHANVSNLSFFGNTKVGGILKESDDSVNQLKFSDLEEILIINPKYQSVRYKDKEFVLIAVKTKNRQDAEQKTEEFLAPARVIICAIEQGTNIEKAWFLNKINKIIIKGQVESKQITSDIVNVKKEVTISPSKTEITETKKEVIESQEKDGVKKKVEKEVKETLKNASGTTQVIINQELPSKQLEEKLEQQEKAFNEGKKPQTIWGAFINIIDAVINLFKVIIAKFLGFFGL